MGDKSLTQAERKELERLRRADRDRNRTKEQQKAEAETAKKMAVPAGVGHQPNSARVGGAQQQQLADANQEPPKSTRAEWVMVVFTGVLVVVSVYQWSGLKSQIRQTDKTLELMRLDNRAWISIERRELKDVTAGKSPVLTLTVKNIGNTPATITEIHAGFFTLSNDGKKTTLQYATTKFDDGRLLPPQGVDSIEIESLWPITQRELASVESRDTELCAKGTLVYSDAVGTGHSTSWQCVFDPKTGTLRPEIPSRGNAMK